MVNQVNLVGFVGSVKKVTDNLYTFSVATTESYKDKSGEYQNNTSWHNVSCFGDNGYKAYTNISVGDLVYVTGRLSYTKKDNKTYTNILLGTYRIIKRKGDDTVSDNSDISVDDNEYTNNTKMKLTNRADLIDDIDLSSDPVLDA